MSSSPYRRLRNGKVSFEVIKFTSYIHNTTHKKMATQTAITILMKISTPLDVGSSLENKDVKHCYCAFIFSSVLEVAWRAVAAVSSDHSHSLLRERQQNITTTHVSHIFNMGYYSLGKFVRNPRRAIHFTELNVQFRAYWWYCFNYCFDAIKIITKTCVRYLVGASQSL